MGSCISNFINTFQTEIYRYIGNRIEIVLAEDREDGREELLRTSAGENIVLDMEDGTVSEEGKYSPFSLMIYLHFFTFGRYFGFRAPFKNFELPSLGGISSFYERSYS